MGHFVKVNLNNPVKVKLTEYGMAILELKHAELNKIVVEHGGRPLKKYERTPDADGYVELQLWELMQTFGQAMLVGGRDPIEIEILCSTDDAPGAFE